MKSHLWTTGMMVLTLLVAAASPEIALSLIVGYGVVGVLIRVK